MARAAVQGPKALGASSVFPGHKQGAGWEVEQPGLEPALYGILWCAR